MLFQNCHAREQAHRSTFDFVRRRQQHFAIAFEKCSRDPSHHVLGKTNRAVFQSNVDRRTIQRCSAHLIHTIRIKPHLPKFQIERLGRFFRRVLRRRPSARQQAHRKPDGSRNPQAARFQ